MTRPILKIPLTKTEKLANFIGSIGLLFLWGYAFGSLQKLPTKVPLHFNLAGEPGNYISKYFIFLLPLLMLFLYIVLTYLAHKPHIHRYVVKITEQNAYRYYLNSRQTVNYLNNSMVLIFACINFEMIQIAFERKEMLNMYMMWFLLLIVFFIIIYKGYKAVKMKN